MSFISGTIAKVFESESQKKSNKAQVKATEATNKANLALHIMSRGGKLTAKEAAELGLPADAIGKSSSILPYYLSGIEESAGQNASELVSAMQNYGGFDSPEAEMDYYRSIIGKYQPAFDAAGKVATQAVDGTMSEQMLAEAEPVFAARTNLAQSKKSAGLEAIAQTLNEINAIQARKGYTGDSLGNRMLEFNARRMINQEGAADIGNAALENAIARAAIQQQGRQLQLGSLNLPDQVAQSELARTTLPASTAAARHSASLAPLEFFRIGIGNVPRQQAPPSSAFTPVASTGQAIATGVSALGNAGLNIWASQLGSKAATTAKT